MILITFPYSQPGPRYNEIVAALWAMGTSAADCWAAHQYATTRPGYRVHVYRDDALPLRKAKDMAIADRAACVA